MTRIHYVVRAPQIEGEWNVPVDYNNWYDSQAFCNYVFPLSDSYCRW